ncbi:hypothetical protein PIGHUM_04304 [Pigmentiphaga humi]|uniref:DUF4351 domain-containing protein n=2 Tax=Pigmentiphaga humi TaxID=2478468 RepID=A0A3P4B7D6_9BURK|nr:hypothetical protein PIGHUM_04304 [Pigmentiphaga humi]
MITAEKIDWSLRWKQEGLEAGREEGREEGRKEGRREGLQEGKARLLEQQLVRRFGPLPLAVRERLAGASDGELDSWALNVLDAANLEAVFRG